VLATLFRRSTTTLGWRTDATSRTLIAVNEHSVRLTASEWVFVQTLRKNSGRVVSREDLVRSLGQDPASYDPRRMDTLVQRLRQKTDSAGLGVLPLQTRHGLGYVWQERSN
jgi:two-component system OmpR family response regulator